MTERSGIMLEINKLGNRSFIHLPIYTSHGHKQGFYSELVFVDSKTLKLTHSQLRNCFSNTDYQQKSTDRNPHP